MYNLQYSYVILFAVCLNRQMRNAGWLTRIARTYHSPRPESKLCPCNAPKCKTENSETVSYCVRCHTPLKYTCPACKHVQLQGGKCEKCGVDFAKYATMLVFQTQSTVKAEREKAKDRAAIVEARIIFLPVTGGYFAD